MNLVAFFRAWKSILASLRYLILKVFWGSMPPDPLEELRPMVKIEIALI